MYQTDPEVIIFWIFFFTVFAFAYAIRIFEIPYCKKTNDMSFEPFFNSVWFTIISVVSVGFGDLCVCTFMGELIAMVLAFWSVVFISTILVAIEPVFEFPDREMLA